ncbi:MAG TPA: SIS domain-containing protein [Anaerolineaceae bacterium]|nr:SIS domain-containing protein [Anaerolineaceae bacterium]
MNEEQLRKTGYRVKKWGITENVEALIEGTAEYPIMYRALGTEPKTQHPFNLHGDIRIEGKAVTDTLAQNADLIPHIADELVNRGINHVIGSGLGTSQFVAQVAAYAYAKFSGWVADQEDAVEFQMYARPYDYVRSVFMAYSGSGSTPDSNRAAQKAKDAGAYVVAFTSIEGSPLSQIADENIVCAGGYDTGGSDTFHYATRLAASQMLALEIGRRVKPGAWDYDELADQLRSTGIWMDSAFEAVDARCHSIARRMKGARAILTVGSGAQLGTAEELSLKFEEMAHIPTHPMCWGRHIHGALGLTNELIYTIIIAPPGEAYEHMIDIARVTQMLKSSSIAIVAEDDERIAPMVDDVIRMPKMEENIFSVPAILPGQLLPYWCAVEQGGINPDCQRSNIPRYARVWNWLFPPNTH